jgi:hypothetical protein
VSCTARCAGRCVKGHQELPVGGHEICPVAANKTARWRPWDLPRGGWLLVRGLRWGVADGRAGLLSRQGHGRRRAREVTARGPATPAGHGGMGVFDFIRQSRTLRNVGGRAHVARVAMPTLPEVLLLGVSVPGVAGRLGVLAVARLGLRVVAAAWGVT